MKENFITYEDGNFTGQLGRNFMCILLALKGYLKHILRLNARLLYLRLGSPLSHQQLLTSIPSNLPTSSNGFFIEIHENIIRVVFFIEDDIWALEHEDVCNLQSFVTVTALEILRQILRQYPRFIQTYETFVHMNQSLCTSWCFIKSIKMQITWS